MPNALIANIVFFPFRLRMRLLQSGRINPYLIPGISEWHTEEYEVKARFIPINKNEEAMLL